MASGAQHYHKAEMYRERATEGQNFAYDSTDPRDVEHGWRQAAYYNAAAQVHATLALAAATVEAGGLQSWEVEATGATNLTEWGKAVSS